VYFRLGLYPRAITIYEEIVRARPQEITPQLNLGLCFLKTGQLLRARDVLTALLEHAPDHQRAWGYLGLVHQRLGELEKAAEAFSNAGQPHMAERMLREQRAHTDPDEAMRPERVAVREVASVAVDELEGGEQRFTRDDTGAPQPAISGRWMPVELGEEPMPPSRSHRSRAAVVDDLADAAAPVGAPLSHLDGSGSLRSPRQLADEVRLSVPDAARIHRRSPRAALLRLDGAFVVRPEHVRALSPDAGELSSAPVPRRARGLNLEQSLGGARPFRALDGSGTLLLTASPRLLVLALERELLFVREDHLVGFDRALAHECGVLAIGSVEQLPMVQLSGRGLMALRVGDALASVEVSAAPVLVRGSDVLGWVGRMVTQPAPPDGDLGPGLVRFHGQGAVLLDPS